MPTNPPAGEWQVWLPFPPSVNNLFPHRIIKGKVRRFPSKQYSAWKKEAFIRVRAAKIPLLDRKVTIHIQLTPRDSRPRDTDNYSKAILDILKSARALVDDSNKYVATIIPWWTEPDWHGAGAVVTIRLAHLKGAQMELPGMAPAEQAAKAG